METRDEGEEKAQSRARWALAVAVAALTAPTVYLAARAVDHARGRAADPSLILATPEVDYYYRLALGLWAGSMAMLLARSAFGADRTPAALQRWARIFARLAVPLAVLCALLAVLLP